MAIALHLSVQHEFAVGELVTLLSGGPAMTVLNFCEDCGNTDVAWFIEDSLEIVTLPAAALRPWVVN